MWLAVRIRPGKRDVEKGEESSLRTHTVQG